MNEYIYVGLLRADGTEPESSSGYKRTIVQGTSETVAQLLQNGQIVFPDVTDPGYGEIVCVAAWKREYGGVSIAAWPLPEPVTVHAGVVPVIHKGKLLMGVDVKARCIVKHGEQCKTGGVR